MKYDTEQIANIVNSKRRSFRQKAIATIAVMLLLFLISILNFSDYLTVLCSLLEFPLILLLAALIKRSNATVLFTPEIKGRNIKEYEYAIHGNRQERIYRKGNMPHTFTNKKILPLRLNGTVYLKLDDGNVKSISGLYKSHMDIYEDGDILLKYAGTKFPIILSREVKKQPCPICGEVNDETRDVCRSCGLGIIKN